MAEIDEDATEIEEMAPEEFAAKAEDIPGNVEGADIEPGPTVGGD